VTTDALASLRAVEDDSPRTLRRYQKALSEFHSAYKEHLATGSPAARSRAVAAIPAASEAMDELGIGVEVLPPPALGGYRVQGLYNVAFLHERYSYGDPKFVIDFVENAQAAAKLRLQQAKRRRRNPLYWGDRVLRAILGFPVYLVGLILRIPPERLDASAWGTVLRVAGLAAEIALVAVGGRQVGWW
jgi:hypothetical protein